MTSIPASTNILQEETVPPSHYPIAKEKSANRQPEDQVQQQDHETEEETRRRLDEWRYMAANLQGSFTQMPDAVRKDSTLSTSAKMVYEHLLGYMWQQE